MSRVFRSLALGCLLAACAAAQVGSLTIQGTALAIATIGQPYLQSMSASGGLWPYQWKAAGTMPPGVSLSPDGQFTGAPTATGTYNLTVTVTDARGATATQAVTIYVAPATNDLKITSTTLTPGVVGQSYSQPLTASGGVPPYKWSVAQALPAGLSLDAATGIISGTPAAAGVFGLVATVTDAIKVTATGQVILKFTTTQAQVSITTAPPLATGTTGQPYVQVFTASGGTTPYTWSILSGSTDGLTLDTAGGVLQGTPTAPGSFGFVLQVADAAGAKASQAYTLTVNGPTMTLVGTGALPSGTVGVSYSQRVPLTVNGGTAPYTWSIAAGSSLPGGLTFGAADQSVSGTPTTAGSFTFTIQATDANGATASRVASMTVQPQALSLTSDRQLPDANLNQPYSFTAAATGGQAPYRWSTSGLPAGLNMNPDTGEISGTPTAAGAFPIAITVVDSALAVISDRFSLNVQLPAAPKVTASGLPSDAAAASQFALQIAIDQPYAAPITGEAVVTFTPDNGPVDKTVQFVSGGASAPFSIAQGSMAPPGSSPLVLQTGTTAGTISISVRLLSGGIELVPLAPMLTARVAPGAPVIAGAQVTRNSGGLAIAISGYATSREVTQAVFTFKATNGQTLQSPAQSITVPVTSLFGPWFQDPANGAYGTQFVYTQPFTVQGDASAVVPDTVTLTNRLGSTTFPIAQ